MLNNEFGACAFSRVAAGQPLVST